MKFLFLLVIVLLFQNSSHSQSDSARVKQEYVSDYGTVNCSFGKSYSFPSNSFSNNFEQEHGYKFGMHLNYLSLNVHCPIQIAFGSGNKNEEFDMHIGLGYKYATPLNINDSTSYRLNLYDFNFALGKDVLYFWKNFDIALRVGTSFGMATLLTNNLFNRNPFFDIVLQAEPRITIWKISFSAKAELGLDISSKNWKPKKNALNPIMSYRNNFYSILFSVGFRFH